MCLYSLDFFYGSISTIHFDSMISLSFQLEISNGFDFEFLFSSSSIFRFFYSLIHYLYKGGNSYADGLAKHGSSRPGDRVEWGFFLMF